VTAILPILLITATSFFADLRTKDQWPEFQTTAPVILAYGGTIPYTGGALTTKQAASPPFAVQFDLSHRYMLPGTGGLRIGNLSIEWDADGWQAVDRSFAEPVILHRQNQARAWTGKRVTGTIQVYPLGIRMAETMSTGQIEVTDILHVTDGPQPLTLWATVAKPENAPRWLSVGFSEEDPTPTPTETESPTATPTDDPTAIPTDTPTPWPTFGPEVTPIPEATVAPSVAWIPDGWIPVYRWESINGVGVWREWWARHIRRADPKEEIVIPEIDAVRLRDIQWDGDAALQQPGE